jgi:predicted SAM-dependent methyltransferase
MLSREKCPKHAKDGFIAKHGSIRLDIGCGLNKQPGFIGLDKRELSGVDIIHDLEQFPYPIPDDCCSIIIGSHIVEHIKPWFTIDLFNELWRISVDKGALVIATPYAGNKLFWQDPTHCNGFNEVTFQYFDPDYPLYMIYEPSPWKLRQGFPVWQANGILEVIMDKRMSSEDTLFSKAKDIVREANAPTIEQGI